nr:protein suppressor of hairy wing-like [Rhipicephalus microplus]
MLLNIMPTKGDHSFNGDEYESKSNAVKSGQAPISLGHEQCQKVPAPPLSCPICNKAFGRKYHLARHLRNAVCSTEHKLSLPCPTCGKLFSSKAKLDYHVTTHEEAANNCKQSPLRRFECHQCGRLLWSQSQLKIHQRTHTGERPFACPECSKTFVSLGALNKHKLSHSKEKPFVCPHCPARFSLKGTLNRHIPTHTGIRSHKCPHCSKDFIQVVALQAHLVTHTGSNGFPCHVCGHMFSRKSRMKEHVLCVHEGQRNFKCNLCSKKFSRKDDLVTHQEHRHGLGQHLGSLNPAWSSMMLMTMASDSLSPPRTYSDDALINESVITRQSMLDASPDSGEAAARTELAKRHAHKFPSSTRATCNAYAFQQTDSSDLILQSKKLCMKPSGTADACLVTLPGEISQKGISKNRHSKEKCTDTCAVDYQNLERKYTSTSCVFATSERSDFCLKRDPSLNGLEENCDNLKNRIEEFLCSLIEKPILKRLGWPNAHLSDLLESVIRHCGCSPSESRSDSLADKLRENCKILFTKVLEDDVAGKLLDDDQSVDAVLDKVLELARLG